MHDFLVIGSTTLDLFFIGDNFTRKNDRYELAIGGKYVADNLIQKIGGGGANVSIGLARQGFSTIYWGVIDKSFIGQYIIEEFKKESIDTKIILTEENSLSISVILLNGDGEKTIITHHSQETKRILIKEIENILSKSRWVIVGNSSGNSKEEKVEWVKIAKTGGAYIFLTLTSSECKKGLSDMGELIKNADWTILNKHELADLVGIGYENIDLSNRNFDLILNTKGVIVTDGENGAYAYSGMKRYYQRAIKPVKMVDTTGAGDAFACGFISEFYKSSNIEQSLLFASQNSASVISVIGAQDGLLKRS